MQLSIHGVTSIELRTRFTSNSGQRTIRITSREWIGGQFLPVVTDITLYGDTELLEALPYSADFSDHDYRQKADANPAQIDLEEYLAPAALALTEAQLAEIAEQAEAAQLPDMTEALDDMAAEDEAARDDEFNSDDPLEGVS